MGLTREIKWYQMWLRLIKHFCFVVIPLDLRYTTKEDKDLFDFLEKYKTLELPKYIPEKYDCDDFAWVFKAKALEVNLLGTGFVVGKGKGGLHCWNICVTIDNVYFIEPQTGKIVDEGYWPFFAIM